MANQPLRIDAVPFPALATPAPIPAASYESLIARIAAGDKLAMRALFSRHQVRVYRFVLRAVHDPELAEDLVSEVFLDVWRHAGQFAQRAAASTWLLSIARHKALSALRKRKDAPLDETTAGAIPDTCDDPEVAVARSEQGAILRDCLQRLSANHREIIDLAYYQGMRIEAVAEILGIPPNTVKTRMFHARRQLASLLQAAGVERWGRAA
jgi:RNA polymerase sigma-70 factor (ECF subfamily)